MESSELGLKPGGLSDLLNEIRSLIEEARRQTASAVNVGLTSLYWRIGNRILLEVLGNERATYGEQIVATLSRQLAAEFGRGFEKKNLHRMMQFAQAFSKESIVATLWRQLSWSHFRELLPLNKPHQRDLYAERCRIEEWSVRMLHERIESMLYERTALSKQPDELVKQELAALHSRGDVTPSMLLKYSYLLDFLGLTDRYLERDLEDAILHDRTLPIRHPRGIHLAHAGEPDTEWLGTAAQGHLLVDGNFGVGHNGPTWCEADFSRNLGPGLGIPGTNSDGNGSYGADPNQAGLPSFAITGFETFGNPDAYNRS